MSYADVNPYTYTNNLEQLCRLRDAGIRTVEFSVPTPLESDPPWFGRTLYHREGRDFRRPITPDFYTKAEESVSEWRLHVARNPGGCPGFPGDYKVIRVGWKYPEYNTPQPKYPIRNRHHGWRIRYFAEPGSCPYPELMTIGKRSIAVLGWDIGAVDILRTKDRKFAVLEANSCPGLRETNTFNVYTRAIGATS